MGTHYRLREGKESIEWIAHTTKKCSPKKNKRQNKTEVNSNNVKQDILEEKSTNIEFEALDNFISLPASFILEKMLSQQESVANLNFTTINTLGEIIQVRRRRVIDQFLNKH